MRYRLPFAVAAVNWSQLPAARLITLVLQNPYGALLAGAWASTPRPDGEQRVTDSRAVRSSSLWLALQDLGHTVG
jgi:hypothetical protein